MNDLYRDATDEDVASAFIFDNKALQRALKHIYEKDFQPMTEIEESLFNETFRIFTEATDEGISESGTELPVEFRQKIDWAMLYSPLSKCTVCKTISPHGSSIRMVI